MKYFAESFALSAFLINFAAESGKDPLRQKKRYAPNLRVKT